MIYDLNLCSQLRARLESKENCLILCMMEERSQLSSPPTKRLVFPKDATKLLDQLKQSADESPESSTDEELISNFFFELANTDEIAFECAHSKTCLLFPQDRSACGKHTGGIIWETSYVLLQYLMDNNTKFSLGHALELGAGVGFLGQCLAAGGLTQSMVLTDTAEVLVHTKTTLEKNRESLAKVDATAVALDWVHCQRDVDATVELQTHPFNTLLSTDVLFSPQLVDPLLETADLLANQDTVWFVCVQIRCEESHKAFLNRCPFYGFQVDDVSESLNVFGRSMECCLFRITRPTTCERSSKRRKRMDADRSQDKNRSG